MTLPRSDPPRAATQPRRRAPEGACDAHMHMLGGPSDADLWEGRVEDPAEHCSFDTYLTAYRAQMEALGLARTVVVQSILYGTDNSLAARAIAALGHDNARGIALITAGANDDTLDALARDGFEGVRVNRVHGGPLLWDDIEEMAPRLADRGLHVQLLLQAEAHLIDLAPRIAALPVPVVIDHMAWPDVAAGVDAPGFRALRDLLDRRKVWVKLSAAFRFGAAPFTATDAHVAALLEANPLHCLWGSDWPQIMLGDAVRGASGDLLDAFDRVCPDDEVRQAVLVDNPERLYGF